MTGSMRKPPIMEKEWAVPNIGILVEQLCDKRPKFSQAPMVIRRQQSDGS